MSASGQSSNRHSEESRASGHGIYAEAGRRRLREAEEADRRARASDVRRWGGTDD